MADRPPQACVRATRGVLSVLILSDLRNHQANRTTAVVQLLDGYANPRLYDCLMVTHITLGAFRFLKERFY
jgi:hypothetical protein